LVARFVGQPPVGSGNGRPAAQCRDVSQVNPGDTVHAYLAFLSRQEYVGKLYPGKRFQCREGTQVIAEGRVLRILELEDSAQRVSARNLSRTHD
jgi:hypothetical protein